MQMHSDRTPIRVLIKKSGTPFTVTRYQRGDTIFVQGDEDDCVMYVESGRVELTVLAACGKEAICGLPSWGSFLGEEVLAGCVARPHTATAMTPTEVTSLTKADMLHLLASQPEFAERFVEYSVSRTTRLSADLANQLLYTSETRLAHVLLSLADHQEGDQMRCALPHVTQEFIARMVGTTRSRVNMFLGKFKRMGFIEKRGGVLQINPALLADVSDSGSEREAR